LNLKHKKTDKDIIRVSTKIITFQNIAQLKSQWLELENDSTPLFFLTWKWVGAWLSQAIQTEKLILLEAKVHQNIVGLGIFTEQKIKRYGLLKRTQWFLHRTGKDENDQIWIENNNFLIKEKSKEIISQAIWHELLHNHNYVDEFIIAIYPEKLSSFIFPTQKKYSINELYSDSGYYLSLNKTTTFDSYLVSLSKNTQKQIKRSNRLLNQNNNLKFSVSKNEQDNWRLLEKCKGWHIEKWHKTETPSGFLNPKFTDFHKKLMINEHTSAQTIIASLTVNDELHGCLYCFLDDNCAYFYLSAFKSITDNRIKLGLTLHTLFIKWLIENNLLIEKYDFLAGEARYKKSLTNNRNEHSYIIVQKNTLKFKVENKLKQLKCKLRQIFN